MDISEIAEKHGVTERTVYNWIYEGKINAKKVGNKWQIEDDEISISISKDDDKTSNNGKKDKFQLLERIEDLKSGIQFLRTELKEAHEDLADANETISEMQERHDESQQQSNMIIMQLTKQLEQKTLALSDKSRIIDDMRNISWWRKLKTALGFAS